MRFAKERKIKIRYQYTKVGQVSERQLEDIVLVLPPEASK